MLFLTPFALQSDPKSSQGAPGWHGPATHCQVPLRAIKRIPFHTWAQQKHPKHSSHLASLGGHLIYYICKWYFDMAGISYDVIAMLSGTLGLQPGWSNTGWRCLWFYPQGLSFALTYKGFRVKQSGLRNLILLKLHVGGVPSWCRLANHASNELGCRTHNQIFCANFVQILCKFSFFLPRGVGPLQGELCPFFF